jgi:hypothetical protein
LLFFPEIEIFWPSIYANITASTEETREVYSLRNMLCHMPSDERLVCLRAGAIPFQIASAFYPKKSHGCPSPISIARFRPDTAINAVTALTGAVFDRYYVTGYSTLAQ